MFVSLWLASLHRRLFGRRATRQAPVHRRIRPSLEALEDRTVPASFTVAAGDVAARVPVGYSRTGVNER
jgi:hypothetical protein